MSERNPPRVEAAVLDGPLPRNRPPHESPGSGAVIRFEGVVRPLEEERLIAGLHYETYDPMAERTLAELAREVARRHGLLSIDVLHSRGFVGVGECSFLLDVGAPHRKEAMAAMDDFIATMKEDIPIWKRAVHEEPEAVPRELEDPDVALTRLLSRVKAVPTETVPLADAAGRVLGGPVVADRDSPPADMSAMDGFALRVADLVAGAEGTIPIEGEAAIGSPIRKLPEGKGMRIFTGGPVPEGADLVLRREDVEEVGEAATTAIRLRVAPESLEPGLAIRRRGENISAGDPVLEPGVPLTAPVMGALAAFGVDPVPVHRRIRVAIVVTGDELVPVGETPGPTGIRDSNRWAMAGALQRIPWIEIVSSPHAPDEVEALAGALGHAMKGADLVLVTGGVSMGDHDHVPRVVEALGARILFHRLAIKPGKPVLGAVGEDDTVILGLPGNPGSVLATLRRLGMPVLRKRAGFRTPDPPGRPSIVLDAPGVAAHSLTRFLPVRLTEMGRGAQVETRGSGDLVRVASSDGLVEVPAGVSGVGPFSFLPWSAG